MSKNIKISTELAARTDLTWEAKAVISVTVEGQTPVPARIAFQLGLSEWGVRKILHRLATTLRTSAATTLSGNLVVPQPSCVDNEPRYYEIKELSVLHSSPSETRKIPPLLPPTTPPKKKRLSAPPAETRELMRHFEAEFLACRKTAYVGAAGDFSNLSAWVSAVGLERAKQAASEYFRGVGGTFEWERSSIGYTVRGFCHGMPKWANGASPAVNSRVQSIDFTHSPKDDEEVTFEGA